jgi:hypothetical protein
MRKIEKGDETQTKRNANADANTDTDATQMEPRKCHRNLDLCLEGEKSLIIKRVCMVLIPLQRRVASFVPVSTALVPACLPKPDPCSS